MKRLKSSFSLSISIILITSLLLFFFSSCKVIERVEYRDREVEKEIIRLKMDSIHIHNTDTFKLFQKGDTIFSEIIKWRVQYRDKIKTDTVKILDVQKIIEKEVEVKEVKKYGMLHYIGIAALLFIIIKLIIFTRRLFS